MRLYDSHCHPNLADLGDRLTEILADARGHGMRLNVVGVDLESSRRAAQIAAANPDVCRACVAVHPNDVQLVDFGEAKRTLSRIVAEHPGIIAGVGECGLDFHYSREHVGLQYRFLDMQRGLAEANGLPLMLHIRDAHREAIDWLKRERPRAPIVFHCFSEGPETAKAILGELADQDVYLSIPGIVTFKNAVGLQEAVKLIPLARMLVETDAPWLAPTPFRGQQNKPLYVRHTVERVADLKGLNPETVADATYQNATQLFWR